jgi:hypothetical protein
MRICGRQQDRDERLTARFEQATNCAQTLQCNGNLQKFYPVGASSNIAHDVDNRLLHVRGNLLVTVTNNSTLASSSHTTDHTISANRLCASFCTPKPVRFTFQLLYPEGQIPGCRWGWVGPRADLDAVEKMEVSASSDTSVLEVVPQQLYWETSSGSSLLPTSYMCIYK